MKHNTNAAPHKRARVEEAAKWLVDLDHENEGTDEPLDPGEWRRWYQDEANAAELDGLVEFVEQLRATHRSETPTDESVGSGPRIEAGGTVEDADGGVDEPKGPRGIWVKRLGVVCGLLAAGLLMVSLAVTIDSRTWLSRGLLAGGPTYATDVGEQRDIVMSDGSRITLGAQSVIKAAFTTQQRTVELEEGEALFNVAHDATRPFIVVAGRGSIQAMGTAFNVLREGQRVVVTVSEGSVWVAPSAPTDKAAPTTASESPIPMWEPAALKPGQEMSYREDGSATAVTTTDVAVALSWRSGRLQYLQQPLSSVIADVNRYSKTHIEFDPEVGSFIYTGDVIPPKIDAWVENLPEIFPVVITKSDSKHIYLQFREDPAPSKN